MNAYDRAMNHLDKAFSFIASDHEYVSTKVLIILHHPPSNLFSLSERQSPVNLVGICTAKFSSLSVFHRQIASV